jgi:hypothetical protein
MSYQPKTQSEEIFLKTCKLMQDRSIAEVIINNLEEKLKHKKDMSTEEVCELQTHINNFKSLLKELDSSSGYEKRMEEDI